MEKLKKKILIHSLVFSPDGVSTAYLYNDIATAFKNNGYDVVVLTTIPHYNKIPELLKKQPLKWGVWGIYKKSFYQGITVYHVPQKKFKSTILRLIGFIYWHVVSFCIGLGIKNVDVILSPSPPLTIGLINLWLGRIKRCKVIYNVQEIYPDILGKSKGFVYNVLHRIENKIYSKSDAVTTIDETFYNTIINRFRDKEKLHIIPNFVNTFIYHPNVSTDILDKIVFPENNNIKLIYAGNIGFAQDWDTLIQLSQKTKGLNVEYYVIGEGVKKSELEKSKKTLDLNNLHIINYMPRQIMPAILSYSDIQFIFMNPEMERQGFPSKVYTIMACGKPLLVSSGKDTAITNFLINTGCAKLITDDSIENKTDEMVKWLSSIDREILHKMGECGEQIIKNHYTKEIITSQYISLVNNII